MARRQWNIRLDDTEWVLAEQRRIAAGLSRDEWTRRVFRHACALPLNTASTPQSVSSNGTVNASNP